MMRWVAKMHAIALVIGSIVFGASAQCLADIEVGKYAKHYKGEEGLEVVIVDLKGKDPKQKLIKVSGMESKIDDVVLLYSEVKNGKTIGFETAIDDSPFWTVRHTDHRYGKDVLLMLPENFKKTYRLYHDTKESKKIDKSKILASYKKGLSDGSVGAIQRYSGSDLKANTNRTFRRSVNDAKKSCEAPIGAKVEWSTIKKKHKLTLPLASLCRLPADRIENHCRLGAASKNVKKLKGIVCKVGGSQSLIVNNKNKLIWTIPSKGDIDHDQLKSSLSSLLKI